MEEKVYGYVRVSTKEQNLDLEKSGPVGAQL